MMALPSFSFKGIEAYSTRAMSLCGGITIVAECGAPDLIKLAHTYLRSIGLGPEELILVQTPENGDLYQAISSDKALCERISDLVKDGYKIEFFCTRDAIEESFIQSLGLTWRDTVSHPSALADVWNNKSRLRLIAKQHRLEHLFPAHRIVNDTDELQNCVERMLVRYPELVIKRPAWASGIGMVFGNDAEIAAHYHTVHGGVPEGTIVEQSLGVSHVSMSINTRFENGSIADQWFTEQECPQQNGSIVHEGSILGDMPNVTEYDTEWMMEATDPLCKIILKDYPSLTGIVNFDCLKEGEKRFILECNARTTFSTYIQDVRKAILSNRGISSKHRTSQSTCIVRKIVPRMVHDFQSLKTVLDSILFTEGVREGIIPIAIGCLATAGYCYAVAVADSYQQALEIIAKTNAQLEIS